MSELLNTTLVKRRSSSSEPDEKVTMEDFNFLMVIGRGSFGKVFLAHIDEQPFAVKVLRKRKIIELNQIDHIKNEKEILASIQHPFIVNLIESFQDENCFYLVFDFIQGGEIFRLLRTENAFPNDVALFYVAEIILAFEHLHS